MASPTSIDTPLISINNDKLPENRIRDGWHGHSIFKKLEWDDTISEEGRANIDYQIDGGRPYSEQVMRDAGRGEDANVNFMEAKFEDDLAQTPFIEMTTVTDRLFTVQTRYGSDESQRKNYTSIISEEFTKTIRQWSDFDYYRKRLAQQFTRHGVGIGYWEDEFTWKWRADGLGAFKFPRNTESRASAIPYCICKRSLSVTELYKNIRDEKIVREVGRWNVDAVRRALVSAAFSSGRPWQNYSWEEFEAEAKENDIEFGTRAEQVRIYHLWCEEYDGQISHYIGLQDGVMMMDGSFEPAATIIDGQGFNRNKRDELKSDICGNGFLYAHRCRFKSWEQALVPFFYSIGTYGTIHTIRGQGEMNFAPIAISNRSRCKWLDCIGASTSIIVETENANEAENLAYVQVGPFMIMRGGPGSKIVPTAMPDVSERLMPAMSEMARLRRQLSPNATAEPPMDKGKQPQSKYQIQANQTKDTALGSAMMTQFFDPYTKLGKEMYRRMVSPDLDERNHYGAKEAFAFKARCLKRGVPAEAMEFDMVEISAVRTIGNGSPQARQYASEQILELSDNFDEEGKYEATLDAVAAIPTIGYDNAKKYVGPPKPRTGVDDTAANLENGFFTLGVKQPVQSDQNHWVHCEHHMELVKEFVGEFEQGQIDGAKLVPVLDAALDNMLAHSKYLSENQARQKESKEVRKFIQQNSGILEQQQNKLIAEQQRQMEAAQQQQGQNGQADPEEQRKNQTHQIKIQQMQQELQLKQQKFQQELQHQEQMAQQKRRIADLEAAQRISQKAAEIASQSV